MVDFRINRTYANLAHGGRFFIFNPLIRGTLETARRSELLVNVYLFLEFTIILRVVQVQ